MRIVIIWKNEALKEVALLMNEPDNTDWARTFMANRGPLRAHAQRIVGTREQAEDVLQDAYLKLSALRLDASVKQPLAYCFQVVRNLAIDHRRRGQLETQLFADDETGLHVPSPRGTPEQYAINRQNLGVIGQVLDGLPARTRQAFEMYRLGGLKQREIGERLGVSAALVNGLIRDAANALMQHRHMLATE